MSLHISLLLLILVICFIYFVINETYPDRAYSEYPRRDYSKPEYRSRSEKKEYIKKAAPTDEVAIEIPKNDKKSNKTPQF